MATLMSVIQHTTRTFQFYILIDIIQRRIQDLEAGGGVRVGGEGDT